MISFACDYLEGAHPAVLEALVRTNAEQTVGYGLDPHCLAAAEMIRARFAVPEAAVHFAVGGTQVNTLVIAAALRPYEGVLCADSGHINVHETGAPEATGHKILPLPPKDGKITGAQVRGAMKAQADFEHTVRPGMVYVSMSTEVGTVYTLSELADLYDACREEGLYLYVDGARLGTGLASPDTDLTPETLAAHCDAFTIGGTTYYLDYIVRFPIDTNQVWETFAIYNGNGNIVSSHDRLSTMDTKAIIKGGRTYAPIRFLAESFLYTVGWNNSTRTVLLVPPVERTWAEDMIEHEASRGNAVHNQAEALLFAKEFARKCLHNKGTAIKYSRQVNNYLEGEEGITGWIFEFTEYNSDEVYVNSDGEIWYWNEDEGLYDLWY